MNQDPTGNKPFSSSKPPVYIPPVQRPGQTPPMYHPPSEPLHEQLAQDGKTSLEKREHPDSANRQTGPAAASKVRRLLRPPNRTPQLPELFQRREEKAPPLPGPLALPPLPRLKTPEYLRPDTTSRFPVNREQTTNTLPSAALLPKARWPSCFPFCSAPFLPSWYSGEISVFLF